MSRHIVVHEEENRKYVFGWDQHLMSFFLQVHDLTIPEIPEDDEELDPIIVWLGGAGSIMYEVDDLYRAARKNGLEIDVSMRTTLYGEKDDGL